jgi:DNA-binding transcriptional LysR family regulator
MNFNDLNYFVVTANELNVSRASEILHISQPSLSEAIANLEQSVKKPLFARTRNRLSLTDDGRLFLEKAERILAAKRRLDEEMQHITEGLAGRIRLGISSTYSATLLPPGLSAFHEQYPGVEINVTTATSAILEGMLLDDALDIAVVVGGSGNPDIETKLLFYEQILLAVPPENPLCARCAVPENDDYPTVSVDALRGQSFILSPQTMRLRDSADAFFRKEKIEHRIAIVTASIETAMRLSAMGAGIAFIPETYIEIVNTPPLPRFFAAPESLADWQVSLARRKSRRNDILLEHFAAVFEKCI